MVPAKIVHASASWAPSPPPKKVWGSLFSVRNLQCLGNKMFTFEWWFCIPHIIFTAPALLTIISSPFPKKTRPQTEHRHFALNVTRSNGNYWTLVQWEWYRASGLQTIIMVITMVMVMWVLLKKLTHDLVF